MKKWHALAVAFALALPMLTACGGGDDHDDPPPPSQVQGPAPEPKNGSVAVSAKFVDPITLDTEGTARVASMEDPSSGGGGGGSSIENTSQAFDSAQFLQDLRSRVKNLHLIFVPEGDWDRQIYYPISLDGTSTAQTFPLNPGNWELQAAGLNKTWTQDIYAGNSEFSVEAEKQAQTEIVLRMLNAISTGIAIPQMPGEWSEAKGYQVMVVSTLASGSVRWSWTEGWANLDGTLRFSMPVHLGYDAVVDGNTVQVLDPLVGFRFEVADDVGMKYQSPDYMLDPLQVLDASDYYIPFTFPNPGGVEVIIDWGPIPADPPAQPFWGEKG